MAKKTTTIETMGKFTAIGMRTPVADPAALVINTCSGNDGTGAGDDTRWDWANPTNRAIGHTHANDPETTAVSTECMWQGTKIRQEGGRPDPTILGGNWRGGKGRRPVGAWNGPNAPLITTPGEARRQIYLPAFRAQIEHWAKQPEVAARIEAARSHPGPIYLRDHDTGRGIDRNGPMSHAWLLAEYLNTGEWPH